MAKRLLASGSNDNTIIKWDRKRRESITRVVLLPDNQWLAYNLHRLVYDSSYPEGREEKYAAIRFPGPLCSIHPLQYYRKELKRENGLLEALRTPQPVIKPQCLRLWWDTFETKGAWFAALTFVMLIAIVVTLTFRYRLDSMKIAKQFFVRIASESSENIDQQTDTLLQVSLPDSQGTALVALVTLWLKDWQQFTDTYLHTLRIYLSSAHSKVRIYVVYKNQPPGNTDLQKLRSALQSDIVPLPSPILEQAITDDNCPEVLGNHEELYLARTDPYAESKPVFDPLWFYGRSELLQSLPGVLAQGQYVGIFGLRKVGKTSLINQLRQRFNSIPTVFIDCQAWPAKAESYFVEILQQLHKGLSAQGVKKLAAPPRKVDAALFRQCFLAYFDGWQKTGRREPFLLMLDEIDKFFPPRGTSYSKETLSEYMNCFCVLRGLAQTRQCLVVLVVAYRPDVNRHNRLSYSIGENPMFNSFHEVDLGFLSDDDSTVMIKEIGSWKGIIWEHKAAQRVFDYCGGHPFITRLFSSEVCEEGSRKQIDLARVEEVANVLQKTFHKNEIGNYYQEGIWDLLRIEEKNVLAQVCQNGTDPIPEQTLFVKEDDKKALSNLERFGLVTNPKQHVHLTSALFRSWWQRRFRQ